MGLFGFGKPKTKADYNEEIAREQNVLASLKSRLAATQAQKKAFKGRNFNFDDAIFSLKSDIERHKGNIARLRALKANAPSK